MIVYKNNYYLVDVNESDGKCTEIKDGGLLTQICLDGVYWCSNSCDEYNEGNDIDSDDHFVDYNGKRYKICLNNWSIEEIDIKDVTNIEIDERFMEGEYLLLLFWIDAETGAARYRTNYLKDCIVNFYMIEPIVNIVSNDETLALVHGNFLLDGPDDAKSGETTIVLVGASGKTKEIPVRVRHVVPTDEWWSQ